MFLYMQILKVLGSLLCGHEFLDTLVQGANDLLLLDEEAGPGGHVNGAIRADGGVLAASAAHETKK